MKLEQGSWSSPSNGAFPSSSDSSSIKEVSSFPSENTRESGFKTHSTDPKGGENCEKKDIIFSDESNAVDTYTFSDDLGDITQTNNDIDFFRNSKDKDPGDFLYDGWPEIGSFDDVDRMFRNSDSTFGLGANKEDELNWSSSADDTEGTLDVPKSNFRFPLPESYPETNYVDDSAMNCAPDFLKGSSWLANKYESSWLKRHAMTESKDELIPEEEMDEHRKQTTNQNHFGGNRKKRCLGNVNFNGLDQTTIHSMPSSMKFQTKDLINPSVGESLHSSSQLQSLESFHHSYLVSDTEGNENGENISYHQGSQQSLKAYRGNICMASQPSTYLDTIGKLSFSGSEFESPRNIDIIKSVIPAEIRSSNVLESSTKSSRLDDISLDAASFLQLQLVMKQLDLRTRLCIRDSLYRLAQSAERRHNHTNLDDACGDEREARGAFVDDQNNKHTEILDMETDTNPMDRTIAHLLFHRTSDTNAMPANESLPKAHGSVTSTKAVDKLVCGEENLAEIDKGGSNR